MVRAGYKCRWGHRTSIGDAGLLRYGVGHWRLAPSALGGWQVCRGVEVSRAEGSASQSTRTGTTIAILKLMVTQ